MCWPQGNGVAQVALRALGPGLLVPRGSSGPGLDHKPQFIPLLSDSCLLGLSPCMGSGSSESLCSGLQEGIEKVLRASLSWEVLDLGGLSPG